MGFSSLPFKLRQRGRARPVSWRGWILMAAIYPKKQRQQGTTGHQQLESGVWAYGAAAGHDFSD